MKKRKGQDPAQIDLLTTPPRPVATANREMAIPGNGVALARPTPARPWTPALDAQVERFAILHAGYVHALRRECPDLIAYLPVMAVQVVPRSAVVANLYNPNQVSPDKMELLCQSIVDNGFCFPVVVIWDPEQERYVIIDGFHRWEIFGPEWLNWRWLPVVVLPHTMAQRLTATVQFNKARGVHQVDLDADVIRALIDQGLSDEEISDRLKMDLDTVHRYKSLTGIAAIFANTPYSLAWEMVDEDAPA